MQPRPSKSQTCSKSGKVAALTVGATASGIPETGGEGLGELSDQLTALSLEHFESDCKWAFEWGPVAQRIVAMAHSHACEAASMVASELRGCEMENTASDSPYRRLLSTVFGGTWPSERIRFLADQFEVLSDHKTYEAPLIPFHPKDVITEDNKLVAAARNCVAITRLDSDCLKTEVKGVTQEIIVRKPGIAKLPVAQSLPTVLLPIFFLNMFNTLQLVDAIENSVEEKL